MRAPAIALSLAGLIQFGTFILPESAWSEPATAVDTKPIGKIIVATGSVEVERVNAVVVQASVAAGDRQAKVGDFVYKGDVVQTGADGKVGITFTDGTAFNLSSNARMVLNEFVFDPNGKANSTLFSLSKGTFTFVAGKIAKTGDMKVDTPVATMGIRGTTPHVEISADGSVSFSTLLEENKATDTGDPGKKPAKQRQAKSAPSEAATAAQRKADAELDKQLNFKVNICRGC